MDSALLVGIAAGAGAAVTAIVAFGVSRRLPRAVDDALVRLGGDTGRFWWQRSAVLRNEIRRLEEATAASERDRARLAAAVAEAPLGIVLTDDDGTVLVANGPASHYLGARQGEAVAEARMREAIETAILQQRPERREIEIYTPQRRYLVIEAYPLSHGVESVGSVAYIHDVTEPRRVEAMRSDFVANVSHELKTPLGALAVLAETLSDHIDDPAAAGRLSVRVVEEAARLSKLVGDILDLSQAEASERPRGPVDLRGLMVDVVSDVEAAAAEAGVEVHLGEFGRDAAVWGDRRQLETLFVNLLENAVKYSGGDRSERRPRVTVDCKVSKKDVVVTVDDEGIGIPDQHLGRIFERFYRVDRARSRATGGTGLGLSIARHIARNHGGDVTVESQVGVGSRFSVRLPTWREP
ncbi:MAG: GHKL domain-containing protein [Actinobacteria bacterium]|nr:GHKL domain-containing protein [Actinomycetota bacterium]